MEPNNKPAELPAEAGSSPLTFGKNTEPMQLTKEQVTKLTSEELDTYARVILDEARTRRCKLKRARDYPGRRMIPGLVMLIAIAGFGISTMIGREVLIGFFAAVGLLQWHSWGLNRRIDALIDMLELESVPERHGARSDGASLTTNAEQGGGGGNRLKPVPHL